MNFNKETLINRLRKTNRSRSAVESAASEFSGLARHQFESIIEHLVETREEKALGIILNICAVNKIQLNKKLLTSCFKVVNNVLDLAYLYNFQNIDALQPLLEISVTDEFLFEQVLNAAFIAFELTILHDADRKPTLKFFSRLKNGCSDFEVLGMLQLTIDILKDTNNAIRETDFLIKKNILDDLPIQQKQTIASGSYTIRRTVPKMSRNEPCHCGSGKKYKKCCYKQDQEKKTDASSYEGLTKTQIRQSPELVDDVAVIRTMTVHELRKIDKTKINPRQLVTSYQRAVIFKRLQLGFEFLLELKKRPDEDYDCMGHLEDLLHSSLSHGNLNLARKIRLLFSEDDLLDRSSVNFRFHVLENKEVYLKLEQRCRDAILKNTDEFAHEPVNLISLAFDFEMDNLFPGLCIAFCRSAILENPDSRFDVYALFDIIENARIELDLDPFSDPIEEFYSLYLEKKEHDWKRTDENNEVLALKREAEGYQKQISQKVIELQQKKQDLAALSQKVAKNEQKISTKSSSEVNQELPAVSSNSNEKVDKLKRQVDTLKQEIRNQQQERKRLRNQIKEQHQTKGSGVHHHSNNSQNHKTEEGDKFEKGPQNIIIPEYSERFKKNHSLLPANIAATALQSITGFATGESSILNKTRKIETKSNLYRIRLSKDYRLMFKWEKNSRLICLDVIKRKDLETWLRNDLNH